MTRKDFEAIAAALAKVRSTDAGDGGGHDAWLAACGAVANVFETANPRFDRAKFFAACGVGQ